jgi:hypothetical protein
MTVTFLDANQNRDLVWSVFTGLIGDLNKFPLDVVIPYLMENA